MGLGSVGAMETALILDLVPLPTGPTAMPFIASSVLVMVARGLLPPWEVA
jgi:hypothetical protein